MCPPVLLLLVLVRLQGPTYASAPFLYGQEKEEGGGHTWVAPYKRRNHRAETPGKGLAGRA